MSKTSSAYESVGSIAGRGTSASLVIPPPRGTEFAPPPDPFPARAPTRLVIDSRDRDASLFPDPAKYDLQLDDDIERVVAVELAFADVSFPARTTNAGCDTLYVVYGGALGAVSVPHADYTPATLATALTAACDASLGAGVLSVSYASGTDSFTLTSQLAFSADGTRSRPRTLASVLGLAPSVVASQPTGAGSHVVVTPFRSDLRSHVERAILRLAPFEALVSNSKPVKDAFAILSQDTIQRDGAASKRVRATFNPSLKRMTKVSVAFVDQSGEPYDFQGRDHRLELLVYHHAPRAWDEGF
jgi:hypothetical protein